MDTGNNRDELTETDLFYKVIFNTIQDGISVLDLDMRIVKLNQAMKKWYAPGKQYHKRRCYKVFHNRNDVCDDCPAQKALKTGRFHTITLPRGGPAGTPGWIELSAFPIINASVDTIGVVEHVRNITTRKAAEEALINSERRLKDIISFLPDPTFVINREGEVIQWNAAIEKLTDIKFSEIAGKGNFEYALPFYGERRPLLIDLALKPDRKLEKKYSYKRGEDGELGIADSFHPQLNKKSNYLAASASPLYDSKGNISGAIETIRNVTERKLAEQENEKLIAELKNALEKVKTLSGMLPICASCKKIRDDKGYWNQIESYIEKHSQAEFSHGICPVCSEKLYGDQDWYIRMKQKKE